MKQMIDLEREVWYNQGKFKPRFAALCEGVGSTKHRANSFSLVVGGQAIMSYFYNSESTSHSQLHNSLEPSPAYFHHKHTAFSAVAYSEIEKEAMRASAYWIEISEQAYRGLAPLAYVRVEVAS